MQLMLPEKSLPVLAEEMIRLWAIVQRTYRPTAAWPQFKGCAKEWEQRTGRQVTFQEFDRFKRKYGG